MNRFSLTPIAAALAMSTASPAFPQTVAVAVEPARLEGVEVIGNVDRESVKSDAATIGKIATPLRDIPQTVTVINRAVLNAQGATSLSDALRNVPGITIGAAEGGQIGNNINLRGFTARTDIFIDGVRDRGQYYRDTFFIDTIEVLKGPSSMLFGRGSTGGVINQVSKQANLTQASEASVTAGTHDFYRATVDTNQPMSETSAFRISAMGQNTQSTRDVLTNEDYGIAPVARFGIDTPTTVTLTSLFQHNHDMADYGLSSLNGRPAPVDYDNFYGLTDDRIIQDATVLGVRVEHRIDDHLTLRNQTQYDRTAIDARETNAARVGTFVPSANGGGAFTILPTSTTGYTTSLAPQSLSILLQSKDRAIVDDSLFNQTDLIADFETGSIKHTLLAGVEFGRDTYQNQALARTDPSITGPAATTGLAVLSLTDPVYQPSSPRTVPTIGNLVLSNANTAAAYANDTIEFTPEWKAIAGLRFDRYRALVKNSIPSATVPSEVGQNVTFTSVRAGGLWQPTKAQSYYASYGTSFNPSLETLTVTNGQQALDPEKNKSYELGAKWDLLDDALAITTAAFRIEKENARTQISTGVYELDGNIVVKGAELGVTGRVTPDLQVFGGYTYLDARIVQASAFDGTLGKVPANTPKHSATLWATYTFLHSFDLGTGVTYQSLRYASNTNVAAAPSFVRWDGSIAYRRRRYDVRLNLLNITDRDYITALIPSDGGRYVPGAGRTALLTLTSRF